MAAEYSLPVMIHHNIAEHYRDELIYLEEMQRALAHNRNTNIIWAHVGISRRIEIPDLIEVTRELLTENNNLYYDISWIVFEEYILTDLEGWAALITEFPERFMVGSDIVGHWDRYAEEITKFHTLLELLDDETAQMLAAKNIVDLVKIAENGTEKRRENPPVFAENVPTSNSTDNTENSLSSSTITVPPTDQENTSPTVSNVLIIIAIIFSAVAALISLITLFIVSKKAKHVKFKE